MPEDDAAAVRDAVDRPLAARRELHHEQVGAALGGQELDGLLEAHRDGARPLVQQLVGAIDGRVEHAEPARAGREDGLEAHRPVGVAELAGGRIHLGGAVDAPELGCGDAEPVQERVRLGLVVRAVDRVGLRHEHGAGEALAVRCQPFEVVRRLREDDVDALALDDVEDRVGEGGVGAGGHQVERVAEVPSDRALGHVGADEAELALAVLTERTKKGGGARGPGRGDEDGDRSHVSQPAMVARCRRNHRSRCTR